MLKPYSSRVKLVIEYVKEKSRYVMSERDQQVLVEYMTIEDFSKTTAKIEKNIKFRPFDVKTPLCKLAWLKLFTIFLLLIYSYVCFILL